MGRVVVRGAPRTAASTPPPLPRADRVPNPHPSPRRKTRPPPPFFTAPRPHLAQSTTKMGTAMAQLAEHIGAIPERGQTEETAQVAARWSAQIDKMRAKFAEAS